ncbi:hypothetical protein CASFOL_039820 [Castilleja foliolosa]|uniref:Pentatricopeptide repeat-containing protein n=1 Tax=Castilleja foliolosa TaxID=1961234 RepID=A0ABD3BG98_9LAMI
MPVFKLPKLYKHFYSSCSNADSKSAHLLYKRIDTFLFDNISDSRTLLSTHAYIISTGNSQNKFIASKLISSYASLNQPHTSTRVFNCLNFKDNFLWNSIIKAHFSNGNYAQAIDFFSKMRFFGNLPNQFTIPMVVSACAELGELKIGMAVNGLVSKVNLLHENSAVGASLVYMYSKCGEVEYAAQVFDEIPHRDVIAWTALVIGYVQNGESEKGLKCLCEMHRIGGDDEKPNFRTLEGGLQACGDLSALVIGKCLHGLMVKSGISSSRIVQSAALSMYSKCGSIEDARTSFCEVVSKDLFSWTSIIGIYARLRNFHECFQMFWRMLASGVYPDGMVISCLISSLANSMKINEGKAFHGFILRRNYGFGQIVSSSLVSMYCKFGLLAVADKIFVQGHNYKDIESWDFMVVGYEKAGLEMDCINLFREMHCRGIESNINTLMSVIFSCSRLRAIHFGLSVHCHIIKLLFENVSVVNSLINMYGKFGNLTMAQKLFLQVDPDIATWNSLISAHTENGNYFEAINFFEEMTSKGVKPNMVTLVTLLSACAQVTSLENGRQIHNYVKETGTEYEVPLSTALVDMYAKCGEINTAKEIFDSMDEKDVISWNVMISGYGMHGHGKSAIWVFHKMEESGARPNELTFLAVLSACSHSGLVDEAKSFFDKMREYSVVPTLKHYGCMVDLYGRAGYLDEAESLILSMPFAPDGGIWGSLLTACKMHNNAEMGIQIAKRAIEADPENDGYRVLISDFYGCMGTWEDVEQVRKTMKGSGVKKTVGWSAV